MILCLYEESMERRVNVAGVDRIPYDSLNKEYITEKLTNFKLSREKEKEFIDKKLDGIFSLDINEFITALYRSLLGREPDSGSFSHYQRLLCYGMPKQAIFYLFYSSPEFGHRFDIKGIDLYKKIYHKYIFKRKLIEMPFIGWIISLIKSPHRLGNFIIENRLRDTQRRKKENELLNEIKEIKGIVLDIKRSQDELVKSMKLGLEKINILEQKVNSIETQSARLELDISSTQNTR